MNGHPIAAGGLFRSQGKAFLLGLVVLAVLLVAFSLSALHLCNPALAWHDQQRIFQLLLLVAVGGCFWLPQQALPREALFLLAGVFLLGGISALAAQWPQWALLEWARYIGLLALVLLLGALGRQRVVTAAILLLMAGVGLVQAWRFVLFYLMAFLSGIRDLDFELLTDGFTHRRFLGQFQLLVMPVLAYCIWRCQALGWRAAMAGIFAALSVHWCIALILGARGFGLGMLLSHVGLLLIARRYWQLVAWQTGALCGGFLLFLVFFHLIPDWLGIDPRMIDTLRTGLSGRDMLWSGAWNMALANPWLGVGPMHFSAVHNPFAAHPHQVVLQWLAEWGFPATVMALLLGGWGVVHGSIFLRQASAQHLDSALWLSIVGALVLAQVDGVFVMPYTETWLAILVGLGLSRWSLPRPAGLVQRGLVWGLLVAMLLLLGQVLLNELPVLMRGSDELLGSHHIGWRPRFWIQGWIGPE